MKVMIDTNILISAALSNKGTPYMAYLKAVSYPNQGIVCDQNIEELNRIFNRKFPKRIELLNQFLSTALVSLTIVHTPTEENEEEIHIRDTADRPILRAAKAAQVDIFITGDKDFLESGIKNPRIMTAAEFIEND